MEIDGCRESENPRESGAGRPVGNWRRVAPTSFSGPVFLLFLFFFQIKKQLCLSTQQLPAGRGFFFKLCLFETLQAVVDYH